MSLTYEQQIATKKELRQALALAGLSLEQVAEELGTSIQKVSQTLELNCAIENPWVLKEFLADKARELGKEPVEFTALRGDYRDYWFLNRKTIEKRKMR